MVLCVEFYEHLLQLLRGSLRVGFRIGDCRFVFASQPRPQPQHLGEDVREIVRGGNPDRSPSMERRDGGRWEFTLAKEFRRDLKQRSHLFEQSIRALMEVCDSPMSARSNTVKPLRNELRGMWRYRMGDFRLIYQPDKDRRVVHFLGLKPRADAYE